jgi:hypothetical protein
LFTWDLLVCLAEVATHCWQDLMALYRVCDQLLKYKEALERFVFSRERSLFDFEEVITLYDLTNTYFEGGGDGNANAAFGKSKEKRCDCVLVTLALVLDASGFPKRSAVFAGNASEPQTLATMVGKLASDHTGTTPTVVLDARIATEENIAWLREHGYRYVVVSRKRHRQFDPDAAVLIREEDDLCIRAQRVVNAETGEVERYCHSSQRELKACGIHHSWEGLRRPHAGSIPVGGLLGGARLTPLAQQKRAVTGSSRPIPSAAASLLSALREALLDPMDFGADVEIEEVAQHTQGLSQAVAAPLLNHAVVGPVLHPIATQPTPARTLPVEAEPIPRLRPWIPLISNHIILIV